MTRDPKTAAAPHDSALQTERHAALRRFAASLSHAIGTPLNVVAGRAELIELDTQHLPDVLDSAVTIRRQAERITDMLKGALKYVDALDTTLPRGNLELLEELRAIALSAGWSVQCRWRGPATELLRGEAIRAYVLGMCRLGDQLDQATEVEISADGAGVRAALWLSPGLQIAAVGSALEPWLEAEAPAAAASGKQALEQRDAVQLAVALGCARDAGADLALIQHPTQTEISASWQA